MTWPDANVLMWSECLADLYIQVPKIISKQAKVCHQLPCPWKSSVLSQLGVAVGRQSMASSDLYSSPYLDVFHSFAKLL